MAALSLCLAGAMVSGLLLLQHHGEGGAVSAVNQVCGEGEDGTPGDCETVARSSWSSFAGFPIAGVGLVFFASLTLLLALALFLPDEQRPWLAGLASLALALGLLVDLFLFGVQAFAIRAFCTLCLVTYALAAGSLFALLPAWRGSLGLGAALGRTEGRLALAGWVFGTLGLVAAVLATEAVLDAREQRRQVALLGAPTADLPPAAVSSPPAPPESTAAAEPGEPGSTGEADGPRATPEPAGADAPDAAYWERRARELQATLDDPQKLEQYFARKAETAFESAPVEKIDLEGLTPRGPADAPVKVVTYSDFLCPFCRNLGVALAQFVPQAGGRVAVYFKNFPLDQKCNESLPRSTHPGSCQLALGALCAGYQGKFDAYHDRIFSAENLGEIGPAEVIRLAGEAGLNPAAMKGCLADPATRGALDAQIAEGQRLEVRATPTVYVNGKKLPRINDFVPTVDREAQNKGFPPLNQ